MRVLVEAAAVDDIDAARAWYRDIDPALQRRFEDALRAAVAMAAERPRSHAVAYRGLRRALTRTFPYVVYFRFEPEAGVVRIVACLHARQSLEHLGGR